MLVKVIKGTGVCLLACRSIYVPTLRPYPSGRLSGCTSRSHKFLVRRRDLSIATDKGPPLGGTPAAVCYVCGKMDLLIRAARQSYATRDVGWQEDCKTYLLLRLYLSTCILLSGLAGMEGGPFTPHGQSSDTAPPPPSVRNLPNTHTCTYVTAVRWAGLARAASSRKAPCNLPPQIRHRQSLWGERNSLIAGQDARISPPPP